MAKQGGEMKRKPTYLLLPGVHLSKYLVDSTLLDFGD